MSDNPFASPDQMPPQTPSISATKPAPGALTFILIVCLIFGIMGLCGSCFTGIGLAMQSTLEKMLTEGPGPAEQKDFQKMSLEVQGEFLIPGLAIAGINLFVATFLIIGSIAGLQRKPSAVGLMRNAILFAIIYVVLKIIFAIYTSIGSVNGLTEKVQNYQGAGNKEAMETMLQITVVSTWVGLGIGILFPIAMMGFYIWARIYMGSEKVKDHLGAN